MKHPATNEFKLKVYLKALLSVRHCGIFSYTIFQTPPLYCSTFIFADDITVSVQAKSSEAAQQIVQPYLETISQWATKWHLNYFLNKLDPSISPVCPYNYNAMDNIQHVLIDCPILSAFRLPLLSWLNDKRLIPTISTILGFNPTITSAEQICLRNRLIKFIKSSGLILRL